MLIVTNESMLSRWVVIDYVLLYLPNLLHNVSSFVLYVFDLMNFIKNPSYEHYWILIERSEETRNINIMNH